MKLVVLAGAKKDAVVPLKKDKFVIGRSKECSLRAGSDAISRKHCELSRTADGFSVRDLGSRNGTLINGEKISEPHTLQHGDLLKIGPLEFRFEAEPQINKAKQPKVASVGDALDRTASKAEQSGEGIEDSISDWLIDTPGAQESMGLNETQTFTVDETRAVTKQLNAAAAAEESDVASSDETAEIDPEEAKAKAKEPGKLPKDAFKSKSKDSREAAEQILRDMARRR